MELSPSIHVSKGADSFQRGFDLGDLFDRQPPLRRKRVAAVETLQAQARLDRSGEIVAGEGLVQ